MHKENHLWMSLNLEQWNKEVYDDDSILKTEKAYKTMKENEISGNLCMESTELNRETPRHYQNQSLKSQNPR